MLINTIKNQNEYDRYLAYPNYTFEYINDIHNKGLIKSIHIPLIHSYLYLIGYMYKYGKYADNCLNVKDIKEVLNFSRLNKEFDYIIKKNGVLDNLKLTESTTNFTIGYEIIDDNHSLIFIKDDELVRKTFYSNMNLTNRYVTKKPLYLFDNGDFAIENTTLLDFKVFQFCMKREDLGSIAFYIYSYLKHKNDKHVDGYDSGRFKLSKELNISSSTISRYRDVLKDYNMIKSIKNNHNAHKIKVNTFDKFFNVKLKNKQVDELLK